MIFGVCNIFCQCQIDNTVSTISGLVLFSSHICSNIHLTNKGFLSITVYYKYFVGLGKDDPKLACGKYKLINDS